MKNQTLIILLLIGIFSVKYASGQVIIDVNGEPLKLTPLVEVDGSPFISKSWTSGDANLANGKMFKGIDLKYDEVKDALIFRGKEDKAFYFTDLIKEFNLNEKIFKSGFLPYKDFSSKSFFEIITSGKITLLKKNDKKIVEAKDYNSATTAKKVIDNLNFYIAKDDKIIATQKDNLKTILNIIDSNKSNEIIEFASNNKLNSKKGEDLKKIIDSYNKLP